MPGALLIGGTEFLMIVVAILVFIFGAKKLPELARALGRARGEFERGKRDMEGELKVSQQPEPPSMGRLGDRERLERVARILGISPEGKSDEELKSEIKRSANL